MEILHACYVTCDTRQCHIYVVFLAVLRRLASVLWMFSIIIIFFKAEDSIRDVAVTGVQTCALPICDGHPVDDLGRPINAAGQPVDAHGNPLLRSEERRVGKECRSRWSPYH